VGRDLTWNWLRGNWPQIYQFYKSGSVSSAASIIGTCAGSFNKEFELKELKAFYDEKILGIASALKWSESVLEK
jgi:hypothetical protein